jgi:hypothetical protein
MTKPVDPNANYAARTIELKKSSPDVAFQSLVYQVLAGESGATGLRHTQDCPPDRRQERQKDAAYSSAEGSDLSHID